MATLSTVIVLGLCYRLPIWLMDREAPWELRSTNDHLTADAIGLGLILFLAVTLPALTKILYTAWSPDSDE